MSDLILGSLMGLTAMSYWGKDPVGIPFAIISAGLLWQSPEGKQIVGTLSLGYVIAYVLWPNNRSFDRNRNDYR